MELNPRRPLASAWLATALALGALAGCSADTHATAVQLTIRYDEPPARLRVIGRSEGGMRYGPESLPDPPRPLAAREESVLLQLSDGFDRRTLELDVAGLDREGQVRMQGSLSVLVRKGGQFARTLRLEPVADAQPPELEPPSEEPVPPTDEPEPTGATDPGASAAGASGSASEPTTDPAAAPQTPPASDPAAPAPPVPVPGSSNPATPPSQAGAGGNQGSPAGGASPMMGPEPRDDDEEDGGADLPLDCGTKPDCKVDCNKSSCGAVLCDPPARCLLECKEAEQCAFASCPSGAVSCSKNRLVCNRPCP